VYLFSPIYETIFSNSWVLKKPPNAVGCGIFYLCSYSCTPLESKYKSYALCSKYPLTFQVKTTYLITWMFTYWPTKMFCPSPFKTLLGRVTKREMNEIWVHVFFTRHSLLCNCWSPGVGVFLVVVVVLFVCLFLAGLFVYSQPLIICRNEEAASRIISSHGWSKILGGCY
jgi:hypothetical protein